ncbi:hypothetical protein QBC44DRAFT_313871 [Cladorrhinum sp. PSN332]|nr:hypothetical protein QBC44DRAFT_313871 [Cladorrhinum sp. PSN332]
MDWDPDTVPGNGHVHGQGFMECRGPMTVLSAVGDATTPSIGLTFQNAYCLQPQGPFDLITPPPYHQSIGISGNPFFPPSPLEPDNSCYWLDPAATDAAKSSIFHFQQGLRAPPGGGLASPSTTAVAAHLPSSSTASLPSVGSPHSLTFIPLETPTGSAPDSSPTLTAVGSSTTSWSPSPPPHLLPPPHPKKRGRGIHTTATTSTELKNVTMARAASGLKKQTKPSPTNSAKVPITNNSKKPSETPGRTKGQLNPSNFPTLEAYQKEVRLWHNQIGKKYRNKLNLQYESLYAVLHPDEDDKNHTAVAGRTINKARTLDMARQRILDLTGENNALRAEMEQMVRLIQAQQGG